MLNENAVPAACREGAARCTLLVSELPLAKIDLSRSNYFRDGPPQVETKGQGIDEVQLCWGDHAAPPCDPMRQGADAPVEDGTIDGRLGSVNTVVEWEPSIVEKLIESRPACIHAIVFIQLLGRVCFFSFAIPIGFLAPVCLNCPDPTHLGHLGHRQP